uniref:Uncharacterized protein n=1 Tax=Octopus bimaculoides TaxID=37653 RepID=A0A0L8G034_OCTBM
MMLVTQNVIQTELNSNMKMKIQRYFLGRQNLVSIYPLQTHYVKEFYLLCFQNAKPTLM